MQVYSMLVYEGPGLASRMRKELVDLLSENRYRRRTSWGPTMRTFTGEGGRKVCGG